MTAWSMETCLTRSTQREVPSTYDRTPLKTINIVASWIKLTTKWQLIIIHLRTYMPKHKGMLKVSVKHCNHSKLKLGMIIGVTLQPVGGLCWNFLLFEHKGWVLEGGGEGSPDHVEGKTMTIMAIIVRDEMTWQRYTFRSLKENKNIIMKVIMRFLLANIALAI